MIDYKFNEGELVQELKDYIDSTYSGHYSRSKFQATEFIFDSGHGIGFTIGNVLKYAQRYGKKGSPSDARKDLQKILHYTLMALYLHDEEHTPAKDSAEEAALIQQIASQLKFKEPAAMSLIAANKSLLKTEFDRQKIKADLEEIEELAKLADQEDQV